jgi:integrase
MSSALSLPEQPRQLRVVEHDVSHRHPVYVYLMSVGPVTRRNRRYRLQQLASWLSNGRMDAITYPWQQLRAPDVVALRVHLIDHYAPGTVNQYLNTLRGVIGHCWRAGLLEADAYAAIRDVPGVADTRLPAGRDVQPEEVRRLIEVCRRDGDLASIRDVAILALLYGTGMRRAEVAGIALGDYDPHLVSFRVMGKGNKQRMVYAPPWVREPIADWLEVRGLSEGALFTSLSYGRVDRTYRHVTPHAIWQMLKKRVAQAGVEDLSTHDFRRTYVGDMCDQGVDLPTIARNVGHADVNQTARYDRRGARTQQRAAALLPSPL